MSGEKTPDPTLNRLLDELADDLMNLTDEELLAEFSADGIDLDSEAGAAKVAIEAGMARVGRQRLAAAKVAAARDRTARVLRSPIRADRRGGALATFAKGDAKLKGRLTIAARKGEGLTDAEIDSVLADLRELGAIDEDGNPTT
ncbi:hypothetical protein [Sphingobium sp. CR28]|uniref:hypothetical protein n=1 Tax=Sphingobium sp. CR28 TaxID=3400272 RepID=UPI003FEE57F6